MAFTPTYHQRNVDNLNKLGDRTKEQAVKWYQYCIDNGVDILIYETIRSEAKQRENIKNGASQTMKSHHLVGQALDFVPVDGKKTLWDGYQKPEIKKVIQYAKSLGFESGGDWKNFKDYPHLEYKAIGYGKDTFNKKKTYTVNDFKKGSGDVKGIDIDPNDGIFEKGETGSGVKHIQEMLNKVGYNVKVDSFYGNDTENAVKQFQKKHGLEQNGKVGGTTLPLLKKEAYGEEQTKEKKVEEKVEEKPKESTSDNSTKIYQKGDVGAGVKSIQSMLNQLGHNIEVTGEYNDETEKAVKKFQTSKGLESNGKVGGTTLPILKKAVAENDVWAKGSTGSAVSSIQSMLLVLGYDSSVTGLYDEKTENAVKKFQKDNDLEENGKVGGTTLPVIKEKYNDLIDTIVQQGDEGEDVERLQGYLIKIGYRLEKDGIFGKETHSAVVDFQRMNSLMVDGIVSKNTWTKLIK